VCRNHRESLNCENPVPVQIDWLEHRVVEELQKALLHPEAVAEFVRTLHSLQTAAMNDVA
jgi:hypothetical protein